LINRMIRNALYRQKTIEHFGRIFRALQSETVYKGIVVKPIRSGCMQRRALHTLRETGFRALCCGEATDDQRRGGYRQAASAALGCPETAVCRPAACVGQQCYDGPPGASGCPAAWAASAMIGARYHIPRGKQNRVLAHCAAVNDRFMDSVKIFLGVRMR